MLTRSILTLLFFATLSVSAKDLSLEELLRVQTQVQSVLERCEKSIVAIECSGGTASGVIVSPQGLVFTAAHVTETVGKKVKITLHDGRTVEGESLGLDTATDAAMLQLPAPAKEWPSMPLHKELQALQPGDWCFALGHPGGYDETRGTVLRIGRVVKVSANVLQTDCVLMGGDSGGALCNERGELIGINSQIWEGRDQNLHTSLAPFFRSWDLMKRGEIISSWSQGGGGWIGLSTLVSEAGLSIQAIAPGSPAMKAGLAVGDIILAVNKLKPSTPTDFSRVIRPRLAGDIVTLKIKNAISERLVEVKLGSRPED
jgi:serine protease Do